jgi:hypothetical protein
MEREVNNKGGETAENKLASEQEKAAHKSIQKNKLTDKKEQGKTPVGSEKSTARIHRFPEQKKLDDKSEESEKKGNGIFDIFLDFLRALFGVEKSEEELKEMFEKSDAMRGVQAYWRIKPQNKWEAKDYARVIFMLNSDDSKEANTIKDRLYGEARSKGIDKQALIKNSEIEKAHSGSLPKNGEEVSGKKDKREDAAHRAIQMNADLWKEMKRNGEFAWVNSGQLNAFGEDFRHFNPRGQSDFLREKEDVLVDLATESESRFSGSSGGASDRGNNNGSEKAQGGASENVIKVEFTGETKKWADKATEKLGRIDANTALMLQQLQFINDKLKNIQEICLQNIMTSPEEIKKYQKDYGDNLKLKFGLNVELGRLIGEKKTVPWKERDKELYEGTIDQALEERMKRIEYLAARRLYSSGDGDIDFEKLEQAIDSKSVFNPDATNDAEEKGRREAFLERMKRVSREFEKEGLVGQEAGYFEELKEKWVKIILENSEYGTDKNYAHNLKMPVEIYEKFKKIKEMKIDDFEKNPFGVVKELREELKFPDYFRGVSYSKGNIVDSYGYPVSLEGTMSHIAETWGEEGFGIGGKYELMDAAGNFNLGNFQTWMRLQIFKTSDMDPLNPIDPLKQISFKAGLSQLSLNDILYVPQYMQHRYFEIEGDASNGSLQSGWGDPKEHPEMNWPKKLDMIIEAWRAGLAQSDWANINGAKGSLDEWNKATGEISKQNNYTRDGLLWRDLKIASHKGDEIKNYYEKGEQGSLGKAVQDGVLFFRHFTEFTEFYTEKKDGKLGVRSLENNMAYSALGHDGSSAFLLGVAENALNYADPKAREQIKDAYKGYIFDRMEKMREFYEDEKKRGKKVDMDKVKQLVENYQSGVRNLLIDNLAINFDTFDKLVELKLKIEEVAMGKRDVAREDVEKEVKKEMRGNVMDFLKKVMEVEIPGTLEPSEGEEDKIEKGEKLKIGEIEVLLDDNGRIVTKKEWEQTGKKSGNKKKIGEIMGEFGNFADDADLKDYEQAVKENDIKALRRYQEIFERNERLGFAMLTKVANISREQLNIFKSSKSNQNSELILKEALKKSLATIYGLNEIEGKYAYERVWYLLPQMRITSWNNTSGVGGGIDPGVALVRTMWARNTQMGLGTAAGSKETMKEFVALSPPTLLDSIPVARSGEIAKAGEPVGNTILGVLQGNKSGEGSAKMKPRWERNLDNDSQTYLIKKDAQRAEWMDHLQRGVQLWKVIVEEDPDLGSFHEIVKPDEWGVMKMDRTKARKILDAYWNNCRLVYNSSEIDYDRKIVVDGREVGMREHMFGRDIQTTLGKTEEYYKKLAEKGGKDAKAYEKMAKDIKNKPAVAAMMNMVTAGIHEHMIFNSSQEMWSTQNVTEIWWILDKYLHEKGAIEWGGETGNEPEIKGMPSMIPYGLFNELLGVHEDDSMEWFIFKDLFFAFVSGLGKGAFDAWAELGDEIAPVTKTYLG